MNLKNIKEAQQLCSKLDKVEKDMGHLATIANILAHGRSIVELQMIIEDPDKTKQKQSEPHTVRLSGLGMIMMSDGNCDCGACQERKGNEKHILERKIEDTTALQILGVLMERQSTKKREVVELLTKMGIDL